MGKELRYRELKVHEGKVPLGINLQYGTEYNTSIEESQRAPHFPRGCICLECTKSCTESLNSHKSTVSQQFDTHPSRHIVFSILFATAEGMPDSSTNATAKFSGAQLHHAALILNISVSELAQRLSDAPNDEQPTPTLGPPANLTPPTEPIPRVSDSSPQHAAADSEIGTAAHQNASEGERGVPARETLGRIPEVVDEHHLTDRPSGGFRIYHESEEYSPSLAFLVIPVLPGNESNDAPFRPDFGFIPPLPSRPTSFSPALSLDQDGLDETVFGGMDFRIGTETRNPTSFLLPEEGPSGTSGPGDKEMSMAECRTSTSSLEFNSYDSLAMPCIRTMQPPPRKVCP